MSDKTVRQIYIDLKHKDLLEETVPDISYQSWFTRYIDMDPDKLRRIRENRRELQDVIKLLKDLTYKDGGQWVSYHVQVTNGRFKLIVYTQPMERYN